jgi:hypothetical protein
MDSIMARIPAQPSRGNTSGVIPAEDLIPSAYFCVGYRIPFIVSLRRVAQAFRRLFCPSDNLECPILWD